MKKEGGGCGAAAASTAAEDADRAMEALLLVTDPLQRILGVCERDFTSCAHSARISDNLASLLMYFLLYQSIKKRTIALRVTVQQCRVALHP